MVTVLKTILIISAFITPPLLGSEVESSSTTKHVTLKWKAEPQMKKFEIQISANSELDPMLFDVFSNSNSYETELGAATFYYRVRWFDGAGKPGPWTEVEGFKVNLNPPRPVVPLNRQQFKKEFSAEGIKFEWTAGVAGSQNEIEIRDDHGIVLRRSIDSNFLFWKPPQPGRYRWRAGFDSVTGVEWGPAFEFIAQKSAFPIVADHKAVWELFNFHFEFALVSQTGGGGNTLGGGWSPHVMFGPKYGLGLQVSG